MKLVTKISRRFIMILGLMVMALMSVQARADAPMRRPISPNQPMLLVHIDTWTSPDPQKIIDLIPTDIRPYVVMNISLSISHDGTTGAWKQVQYGYETAKSWLRTCAANQIWAMVQPSSGGYSQLSDTDMTVFEEFYRDYPNFLGFNYAEQFWGFDSTTDPISVPWTTRIAHFVDLMNLNHKYGGYLVVSWCGAYYGAGINPIAMMKKNPAFATICQKYPQHFILCEKYTSTYGYFDIESTCLGTYLSGYCGQYGIRFDQTGWTDSTGASATFPVSAGAAPIIEHALLTGETVADGPELIFNQCSHEASTSTATDGSGYTQRNWAFYPQYYNISLDLFRKELDGTIRIPTRQEVINRTKFVIINNVTSGADVDKYSAPEPSSVFTVPSLFDGLYKTSGDGDLLTNHYYFKSSGRYPAIPTVYQLGDTVASSFQTQINKSAYATRWPSTTSKLTELNTYFPQEYTGDLYASRYENAWVTYNPYKVSQTASASIPFKYNTCDHVALTYSQYTAGVMKEYSNGVTFYLTNYDNADTTLKTDTITIYGSSAQPTFSYSDRASHQASTVTGTWSGGVYTLSVTHNGPLDITVNCAGTATGRLTSYTPATLIAPNSPAIYTGVRQYEAETFDYKSITGYVANALTAGTGINNYTGLGYLQFGTSSSAKVRDTVTVLNSGTYRLDTKYAVTGGTVNTIDLYVNGTKVATPSFTQTTSLSDWAVNSQYISLNAGANTIEFKANATASQSVNFDNMVVVPTAYPSGTVIQENQPGFVSVDGTIDTANSGYTGSGYANTTDASGAGINWQIHFDASVTKAFTFRYASTSDSTANLLINGVNVASNIQFPSTGSLTTWNFVTVYTSANEGFSDVRLEAVSSTGLPNIDYVEVTGGTTSSNIVNLRFDDGSGTTALDSTGHGWSGTLVNSPTWLIGSDAKINGALRLNNSSSDYVTLPSGVVSSLSNFTISFWVNLKSISNEARVFDFSTGTSSNDMYFTPKTAGGVMRFGLSVNGTQQILEAPASVQFTAGAWTHVAVTHSGSAATLYINGTAVATSTTMTNMPAGMGSTTANYLGKSMASSLYLSGALDEFQIYDSALSTTEIASLAAPPATPANLVATPGTAKVNLVWDAVTGATSYKVKRATTSGGPYTTLATVYDPSFTDTSSLNGTSYYYVVSANIGTSESANSLESTAVPGTMVACLRFDDGSGTTATDSTGNGWTGTLVNTPTWVTAGAATNTKGALKFSGGSGSSTTAGYVTIPAQSSTQSIVSSLTNFTIAFWVKVNSFGAFARVFDFSTGTTNNTVYFTPTTSTSGTASNGVIRFGLKVNGTAQNLEAPTSVQFTLGTWTHVAVTRSGNTATMYINGTSVATLTTMTNTPAGLGVTTANYIGKSPSTANPYLDGTVDEFQIFNSALSQANIRTLISQNTLTVPTSLTATGGNAQVALSWNAVSGATSYNVKRGTTSGGTYDTVTSVSGTTRTDTSVVNGTTYYYVVTAVQGNFESGSSAQASGRPTAPISAQEMAAPAVSVTGGNANVTVKSSVIGHSYQLQYCDDLLAGVWQNYGAPQNGTGSDITVPMPMDSTVARRFFRVLVQQ